MLGTIFRSVALLILLASSASAATLVLDTDQQSYLVGDTVTLTLIFTTDGSESLANTLLVEMNWASNLIALGPATQSGALTSTGGSETWNVGGGPCVAVDRCALLDQSFAGAPVPVDGGQVIGATLLLQTLGGGLFNFVVEPSSFDALGLAHFEVQFTTNAANASVLGIPEPGTGALLGIGLAVCGARRKRGP